MLSNRTHFGYALASIGFAAATLAAQAQNITFKGVVSDSVNCMLIEGVTVSIGGATTKTDAQGAFSLTASGTAIRRIEMLRRVGEVPGGLHTVRGDRVEASERLAAGIYVSNESRSGSGPGAASLRKSGADYTLTFAKENFHTKALVVSAGATQAIEAKLKSPYPLRNIFKLFQDPTIPDRGPAESPTTPKCGGTAEADPNMIGGQLNRHNFIMIGEHYRRINVVIGGKVAWHYDTENDWEDDDVWVLSNGNVLHAHMKYIEEVTPKKEVVWRYTNPAGTEIHTCQPIGQDKVLFLQNEQGAAVVKLYNKKTKTYEIDRRMTDIGGGPHGQCRRLRYTAQGTYVFGIMSQGAIAEYDKDFKLIKKITPGSLWGAVPLKNGNFLLQREGAKTSMEVNRNGETVWSVSIPEIQDQLNILAPGSVTITSPQTCERLSNGNTVIFTRFCQANLPQAVEVTPDKKVVWILKDWKNLGDAVSMQFLDEPGYPEIPGETNH